MKFPSLRRCLALLLAMALAASLTVLPVQAEELRNRYFDGPNSLDLLVDEEKTVNVDFRLGMEFSLTKEEVKWDSSDTSIATVKKNETNPRSATVKGLKKGRVTIFFTVKLAKDHDDFPELKKGSTITVSSSVNVRQDIKEITITPDKLTMTKGQTRSLSFQIKPNTADRDDIIWESDNENIVTVTMEGGSPQLTAEDVGTVNIIAKARIGNTAKPVQVKVTVVDAPIYGVEIEPDTASIPLGGSLQLKAIVDCTDKDRHKVTWKSSNDDLVKVDEKSGLVKVSLDAKPNETTATITATTEGPEYKYAICAIQVVGSQVTSVTIVPPEDNYLYPGNNLKLNTVVTPDTADEPVKWETSDESVATVDQSGIVTAVSPGEVTITASAGGKSDRVDFEVSGILLSYLKKDSSGGEGTNIRLSPNSDVPIYQGRDITVFVEAFGNAKNQRVNWESSNNSVAQVVGGRVTAVSPGTNVTIKAAVEGMDLSASFKVTVSEDMAQAITVSMGADPSYSLANILSQLNARCREKTGDSLENISGLKVSTGSGTLYYGYASASSPGRGVGGTEVYYYQPGKNQMGIKDITFVPVSGFNETAVVEYNGIAANGNTFAGTIRIEAAATGDISYSTLVDEPVCFASENFSTICLSRTGQSIRYVTFDLPSANRGTLYYNYNPNQFSTKVVSSTRYYVEGNPSINNISFVPAAGFSGIADVTYHCTDSSNSTFTGVIRINVGSGSGSSSNDVVYYTAVDQRVYLTSSEFNRASVWATDANLNYIYFNSLPSSSAGRLYLNYSNSSSTQAASGRSYYRNSSPYISDLTFVPASGFSGDVTIPYTGMNVSGKSFTGSLIIHVGNSGNRIYYTVAPSQAVSFKASDFNAACRTATGNTLNYVIFSLPASTYGTLYYRYNTSTRTGTAASGTMGYYYSGSNRLLDEISFAASSRTGTVSFGYTGYNVRGESFTGRVEIQVSGGGVSSGSSGSGVHYAGSSAPIPFRSSDFQSACQAALGTTLASVQFDRLPDIGHLYQDYSGPIQTGTEVVSGTRYGIQDLDRISYLPRAESQGLVSFPFTAYDAQGGTYTGTVSIQLSTSYCDTPFIDVAGTMDWARPSIEFLRRSGVTNGYSDGTFRPGRAISRGEFTLMLCRAFQFPAIGTSGFADVPAGSVYAGAVGSARSLGIVQGNNGLFRPNEAITRQSAMTMIYRAMSAAGRPAPNAPVSLLDSYADGWQVSQYARPAIAALVQMGAVRGNSESRLNPPMSISRAEMAVILHRVLAQ